MTVRKNDARLSTLAAGTNITAANSAFPDALTPSLALGGTATQGVAPKLYLCNAPDTGQARLDWATGISTSHGAMSAMFDFRGVSSGGDNRLMAIFATGSNAAFGVNNIGGFLRVSNFAGATLFTVSAASIWGKRFRVDFGVENGAGTTDGEIHMDCFVDAAADGTTPTTGWSYHSSVVNAGTVPFTAFRVGKTGSANALLVPVEYVQSDDSTYLMTNLAPLTAPSVAPVLTYTKQNLVRIDSNTTGGTVTLTQTSGPTVTISGPDVSGIFEVLLPDPLTSNVVLNLLADAGGGLTDSEVITIAPSGGTPATVLQTFKVFDGTSWV